MGDKHLGIIQFCRAARGYLEGGHKIPLYLDMCNDFLLMCRFQDTLN